MTKHYRNHIIAKMKSYKDELFKAQREAQAEKAWFYKDQITAMENELSRK